MSFVLKFLFWTLVVYGCAFFLLCATLTVLAETQVLLGEYSEFGEAWWITAAMVADYIAPLGYYVTGN